MGPPEATPLWIMHVTIHLHSDQDHGILPPAWFRFYSDQKVDRGAVREFLPFKTCWAGPAIFQPDNSNCGIVVESLMNFRVANIDKPDME